MEPTYHDRSFNFCWRPGYAFSEPKRADVVLIRFAGHKVMLLKRVVASAGETVEFRDGRLFVDGRILSEPYVSFPCDWNMPPRRVEEGHVYVVGDNRSMSIERHYFGQAARNRIMGVPLW
jgi:signal peptidase I